MNSARYIRKEESSFEVTRFLPMWPGLDSRTRLPMWIEFAVGSALAPRVFLRAFEFSSLLKNHYDSNSNSTSIDYLHENQL